MKDLTAPYPLLHADIPARALTKQDDTQVILVNEKDEWLGYMDKMEAHKTGVLHRALSVFILNSKGELLLQQRAEEKYHSGGLWSNTCCSHPLPGESSLQAAHRRLQEEMGFDTTLEALSILRYKADVGGGLTENEYDHLYIGKWEGALALNPDEAMDWRYIGLDELQKEITEDPALFTTWLQLALPQVAGQVKRAA